MNVMKQDVMDDKITERCKTYEKQYMQEDLDRSRGVKKLSSEHELSRLIHLAIERCRDCDKKKLRSSTDSQVSRRCRASF